MDSFLNVIWAISAGLLSLTGVIGIFIAFSIQQKIDKSREILWELIWPPTDLFKNQGWDNILNTAQYIQQRYFFYEHLEETEGMGAVKPAVRVLNSLLYIVIFFWVTGLYILCVNGSGFEYWCYRMILVGLIYCVILYGLMEVYKLFKGLLSARKLDELPKAKELLDVSKKSSKIPILEFMVNSLFISVKIEKNMLFLRVVFALPFYNFSLEPDITFYQGDVQKINKDLPQIKLVEFKDIHDNDKIVEARAYNNKGTMHVSYRMDLSVLNMASIDSVKISVRIEDNNGDNGDKVDVITAGNIILNGGGWINPELYLMEWMTQDEIKNIDWSGDKSIKC